jgi:hypothetical protein
MKLEDARKAYYDFSKSLSDINRTLGFAGIALVWLFKQQDQGRTLIPRALHFSTILIVASLGLDFLQYVWSAAAWGGLARLRERWRAQKKEGWGGTGDDEIAAPAWINRPTLIAFWAKVVCMAIAYVGILHFLLKSIW